LLEAGFEESELDRAESEARSMVDQAFSFARSNDYPEPKEAFDHVFA
jgi:TPP-dependent pyruvate/acetoin dehydrogenase alpha subunit